MDIILIPGLWLHGSSWDAVAPCSSEPGTGSERSPFPAWSTCTPPQLTQPENLAQTILDAAG